MSFSQYFLNRLGKLPAKNRKSGPQVAAFCMTGLPENRSIGPSRFHKLFLPIEKLNELAADAFLSKSWYYLHGEPFHYPWVMAFIGAVKRNKRRCLVRSSPEAIRKNAHLLASMNVDILQITIPCQPIESRDIESIHQIVESCKREKENSPYIELSIELDTFRPGLLTKIVQANEATLADSVVFSHCKFDKISKRIYDRSTNPGRCLTDDEVLFPLAWSLRCEIDGFSTALRFGKEYLLKELDEEIESLKHRQSTMKIEFYPDFKTESLLVFYRGCKNSLGGEQIPFPPANAVNSRTFKCQSPNWIDILPNGNVLFCHDLPEYICGNVYDSKLKFICKSTAARFFFTSVNKSNPFLMCRYCSLFYMNDNKKRDYEYPRSK